MYPLIRHILFRYEPERAHHIVLNALQWLVKIPGMGRLLRSLYCVNHPALTKNIFGIMFPNPVGLAAGLDKNATHMEALSLLGFGFIEIGTVTPYPQPGNDKPRLFRLASDGAIINSMGFNNEGVEEIAQRLKKNHRIIIGGNIAKNKWTLNEEAANDYIRCVERLYSCVDYFVVNVSSPNTPNLRQLQEKEPLKEILRQTRLASERQAGNSTPKPILLKIAPDLSYAQLDEVMEVVRETQISGIIATNTTLSREGISVPSFSVVAGGLSGRPLRHRATEVIRYIRRNMGPDFPIIGVGGIFSKEDALEKIEAGADLIQLYTGFVYRGPALIREINKEILRRRIKKQ